MNITSRTKVIGILGYPIEQSLSPSMHNFAFEALGLDFCYLPFEVKPEDLRTAIRAMVSLNMAGANITIPHKEKVIKYLDELSVEAESTRAVNTILVKEGKLIGYNTDGLGFLYSLVNDACEKPGNKNILILGAGGAARGIAVQLAKEKPKKLIIANRGYARAKRLTAFLDKQFPKVIFEAVSLSDIRKCFPSVDILINTTSIGMDKKNQLLVPSELISSSLLVCDIIYNPRETKLLKEARLRGARTLNGVGMFVYQGSLSFKIWTGQEAPVSKMREIVEEKLKTFYS